MALAYQEWRDAKERGDSPETVLRLKQTFVALRRKPSGKLKVHKQQLAARTLQQTVQGQTPSTLDDVIKVAHYLQRNIVVLNLDYQHSSPRNVEFQTKSIHDYGSDTTLFLYKEDDHYNAVTSITAFTGYQYYCVRCMVSYHKRYRHRCPDDTSCYLCRRDPSLHRHPLPGPTSCPTCFRSFTDARCLDLHKTVICKTSWLCTKCRRSYPYERRPQDHQCNEVLCHVCKKYADENHQCFIRPRKAQVPIQKGHIRVFDFESDVAGTHHVPNLAAVIDEQEHVTCYENHGDSIMGQFMEGEILNKKYKGFTFIAHNAKGYDAQFIRQELDKRRVKYDKITAGRKILHLMIPHLQIRIIDSLSFISQPLSKFPKMFGLQNIAKGTYPYRFNTKANWSYVGPMPPLEEFLPEDMDIDVHAWRNTVSKQNKDAGDDEVKLLLGLLKTVDWHEEQVRQQKVWNNYEELKRYCILDVQLLLRGLQKFRQDFLESTKTTQWNQGEVQEGVDPYVYVTIAQACMAAMRHKFLKDETIAYIPHSVDVHSLASIQWLEFLSSQCGYKILHARNTPNHSEIKIDGKKVDGFCRATSTVYEFNGCFYHGCVSCYPKKNALYQKQIDKENFLRSQGYRVISIWECEFRGVQHSHAYKAFLREHPHLQHHLPLNVREAFFGGRTNASRLYYKFDDGEKGEYVDFTSLYPYVNARAIYPLGHPQIILCPSLSKLRQGEYFGVAKCTLLPPRALFHPVLPSKINDKLMFPLCRTCAETNTARCSHTDEERAISGAWCTPEIDVALDHGYVLTDVFEVHHFDRKTKAGEGLMQEYVKEFLKGKQESSGWPRPNMSESDKQAYIDDYLTHEGIQLDRGKIEKNPGRRQCCKLMVTSLWGKFGQRGNLSTTVSVHNLQEMNALIFNPELDILECDPMPHQPGTWQITYCQLSEYLCVEPKTTNVYVAAFTTCWARIKLWKELFKLGKRVLYYDTDSIIYVKKDDQNSLELGPYLGDLTNELEGDRYIAEFVSTGPKSYAYVDNTGAMTVKFKGISKTLFNVSKVNLETMTQCVQDASFRVSRDQGPRNLQFNIDRWGRVNTQYQPKSFQMVYTKRYIGNEYVTYPFGYHGN